jgi:hypothetical protein
MIGLEVRGLLTVIFICRKGEILFSETMLWLTSIWVT